jgi:hypothetical protein
MLVMQLVIDGHGAQFAGADGLILSPGRRGAKGSLK